MRRVLLVAAITMAGCNPMPYKQSCRMPDFTAVQGLKVQDAFPTWGYFSERCPKPIPKRFVVAGSAASLNVLVEGEWLRLAAKDSNGAPLQLRGPTLRGTDARVDEQANKQLEVEAVGSDGKVVQQFKLPFEPQECTCVTYDSL